MATVVHAREQTAPGVIVATKLHVPHPPRWAVRRETLVRALASAEDSRLTLVAAPAGSGKTTALAAWYAAEHERQPFAWLSLDDEDNDPVHFWDCVIAALRSVQRGELGQRAEAALHAPGTSLTGTVVPLLINDIEANMPASILVLDDYHAIGSAEVHSSVAYLLDFMPANLHVAIASRSDPPLPIGRIRARGQLSEIRTEQLRFDSREASEMLSGLGLQLAPEDLSQLLTRTEGWAAGLQLAGLSLRGRERPGSLIAALAGDDRQITEYLGVEVLDSLPRALLEFLLRTSILERLHPELCDAVSASSDAVAMLAEAERRNLFLTRLHDTEGWFAYHQLFRDLLRHRLQVDSPESVGALHRRAARWYEKAGYPADAIGHAIAGGDAAQTAELVAAHWSEFFNRGRLTTVSRWLATLPEELVADDSRLWLATVWTAMDRGRLEEVRPWLERPVAPGPDPASAEERRAWTELLRGLHSFKTGDLHAAAGAAARAREEAGARSPFRHTVAGVVLGITRWWTGKPDDAERELLRVVDLAEADHNGLAAIYALGYLALIAIDRGREAEAEGHLEHVQLLVGEEPQLDEHFTAMVAHVARGRLLDRAGDASGAAAELTRACELAARGAGILEQAYAQLALARVEQAQDEPAAAGRLAKVQAMVGDCADAGVLAGMLRKPRRDVSAAGIGEELSERELGVLRLLPTELSLREISSELYVSLNTTKTHVKRIYLKLAVSSREEAVERARELGII